MSTSARMRAVVALLLSLTIGLPAQEEARKPPKPTPQQMDKVDEAHRALFEPKPKTTEKASRYTNKVAASQPRAGHSLCFCDVEEQDLVSANGAADGRGTRADGVANEARDLCWRL